MSTRPLIVIVFRVPLLVEALQLALADVGEVRAFSSLTSEPSRLFEAVRPHVVVVDTERDADAALAFARASGVPAFYLPWDDTAVYTARGGAWAVVPGGTALEAVRNAVVEALTERVA